MDPALPYILQQVLCLLNVFLTQLCHNRDRAWLVSSCINIYLCFKHQKWQLNQLSACLWRPDLQASRPGMMWQALAYGYSGAVQLTSVVWSCCAAGVRCFVQIWCEWGVWQTFWRPFLEIVRSYGWKKVIIFNHMSGGWTRKKWDSSHCQWLTVRMTEGGLRQFS